MTTITPNISLTYQDRTYPIHPTSLPIIESILSSSLNHTGHNTVTLSINNTTTVYTGIEDNVISYLTRLLNSGSLTTNPRKNNDNTIHHM